MPENLVAAPTAILHSFYFGSVSPYGRLAREKFFHCNMLKN
jgi:hypothetical protein